MESSTFFEIKAISDKEDPILLKQVEENHPRFSSLSEPLKQFIIIKQLHIDSRYKEAIKHLEGYFSSTIPVDFEEYALFLCWIDELISANQINVLKIKLKEFEQYFHDFKGSEKEQDYLRCTLLIFKAYLQVFQGNLIDAKNILLSIKKDLKKQNFLVEQAQIYNILARINFSQDKVPEAISMLEKTRKIYSELSIDKGIARTLNNMAVIQQKNEEYDLAITSLEESTRIARKSANYSLIASNKINLGNIYSNIGRYHIAKKNYEDALKFFDKKDDLLRIAAICTNLGQLFMRTKKFKEAKLYLQKAILLFNQLEVDFLQIEPLYISFLISLDCSNEPKAMEIYSKMMDLWNKYPQKVDQTYLKLGNLLMVVQFQEKASVTELLELVLEMFVKNRMKIEFQINISSSLIKIIRMRINNNLNSPRILELKPYVSRLTHLANKTPSCFISINKCLLDCYVTYFERDHKGLEEKIHELKKLNAKLHLDFVTSEIEILEKSLNLI
ncbi:hypothetical protein NEF87_001927 [Candidatus Lokiarchaeum ossiferum]|uniref:Tetratricopeptide repeat protein n=1 Tax=Candidatus Lokiarchaeum ossiferum TaxID=2951803 RepID=A0ABY6HRZ5_9ARCH|nr:hypothetical protein NEF87_001927 [Candidatus Lokiarchaeum sp. B-35]